MNADERNREKLGARFYGGIASIIAAIPLITYGFQLPRSALEYLWPVLVLGFILGGIGILLLVAQYASGEDHGLSIFDLPFG